ncbi:MULTISPECIES: MBL fold metallo-hydrolase RNA specificity domain-containing protein [Azotobacter]|uniref:MBL fold metallo-hydrolase RNA specificity domain-containing protein n=1 Tax=Azotobacter TaxID=352 RepID=UPI0000527731|nr:MBL fold metallo-hydrolase [Azotobacter vinelandii]GLK62480.1 MBL fold hydrolase [Azotobacter vinelandii]SFX87072.1 metallo-beta-lactamase family protein [Azotobacter vinelandii]
MSYPEILHHGATQGVTGSCHQLLMDAQHSLLIDCGLFQGAETSAEGRAGAGSLAIDFALDTVKALIATHVHVDHVGRIPYLLAAGFKGPILCSEPSARLLPIVLEDAFKLGVSSDQRQVERYLELIGQRSIALPYKHWFTLADTSTLLCRIRLQRAGHILGSAYVEIDLTYKAIGRKRRILFSGDLGAPHAPLLPAPRPPYRADTLVIESTYGDRLHEDRRSRRQRLETMIEQALADRGSVLIPAFSIGRTQELLYELEEIIYRKTRSRPAAREADVRSSSHADWPQLPIILDSPLASRFTQAYRELQPFWDREATKRARSGRQPLGFEQLITVENHADHLRMVEHLASTARPAIVIAGSGMCTSGRIVNYLKAMLGDRRHNILFVGYQAMGTPGHAIQKYGPRGGYVDLDGERLEIRAGVATLGGYSAHADRQGLVSFITRMREWPDEIRLVHGEADAKRALGAELRRRYAEKQKRVSIITP